MKDPLDEQDSLCQHEEDHHQMEPVYQALGVLVDADHPQDGGKDDGATKDNCQQYQCLIILPQKVCVLYAMPRKLSVQTNYQQV